jgi:hypothetical protein
VTGGPFLAATTFEAGVPSAPLRLVVSRGATLEVVVEGGPPARSVLVADLALASKRGRTVSVRGARAPKFEGLDPAERYALVVGTTAGDLAALVRGVAGNAGTVAVRLAPSCALRGVVVHPAGGSRLPDADVDFGVGPFSWGARTDARGAFEITGLPPCDGMLSARSVLDGEWCLGSLATASDASVAVPLAASSR